MVIFHGTLLHHDKEVRNFTLSLYWLTILSIGEYKQENTQNIPQYVVNKEYKQTGPTRNSFYNLMRPCFYTKSNANFSCPTLSSNFGLFKKSPAINSIAFGGYPPRRFTPNSFGSFNMVHKNDKLQDAVKCYLFNLCSDVNSGIDSANQTTYDLEGRTYHFSRKLPPSSTGFERTPHGAPVPGFPSA